MTRVEHLPMTLTPGAILGSGRFKTVAKEIRRIEGTTHKNNYLKKIAGYIFEEMAFLTIANQIQSDSEVWSPTRTRRFFSGLYPNKQIIRFGFQETVGDHFVPDGLHVRTEENGSEVVEEMLEYTSRIKPYQLFDALDVKYASFLRERELQTKELGQSRFHFIVPSNADLSLITATDLFSDVRISLLPFSSHELAKYVDMMRRRHAASKPQKMAR